MIRAPGPVYQVPPMRSFRLPTLTLLAFSAAFANADPGMWQWMSENLVRRIFITGHRELGLHLQTVEGDRNAFRDLTYSGYGGRRFTDTGQINIDGRNVLGALNFQVQIQDSRYKDPETQRLSINYKKGPYNLDLGDIQGSLLNTNSFASFNRRLKGVSAEYKSGRFAVKGLRSEAKGSATTLSLQGLNSLGPYYLQSSRVAKDSVQVQVDGQPMKLGEDYTVNYDIGAISFVNRIVPPTSTVAVTYESVAYGGAQGTVQGVGASYDFGKFGRIGLTSLEQTPHSSLGLNTRTDLFQGFGDPSTPYFLSYEPLRTMPIIVKLQGIVQTEGVHYRFDLSNPAVFYFLFPVPATSNVDVTYTPKPVKTVDGHRKVLGVDWNLPLGKNGSKGAFNFNQARGSLDNGVSPMSGTARRADLTYQFKGLHVHAGARDVPNTFVSIESIGFLRNERSAELSLDGSKGPIGYGVNTYNSSVGTGTTDSTGVTTFRNARTTRAEGFVSYAPDPHNSWRLSQVHTSSMLSSGESALDTTQLSNSLKRGRLTSGFSYGRSTGFAPLTTSSGVQRTQLQLDSVSLSSSYDAGAAWTLGARVGLSSIRSAAASNRGTDISANAEYRPSPKLDVQLNLAQSKAGALNALAGLQNGFGIGYGGNGFSSGISGFGAADLSGGTDYRSKSLAVIYQLSSRANMAARLTDMTSSGGISANSHSRGMSLDLDWDLGRSNTSGLSLTRSQTSFLDSGNESDATTLDLYLDGNPKGPWSYRLGVNKLITAGHTQYGQNSTGLDLSLGHKINTKQRLGFAMHSGFSTGYLPQDEKYFSLFHEYQLYNNIALRTSYSWRKLLNNDPTVTSGAYRAHGLDVQLTFDFVP